MAPTERDNDVRGWIMCMVSGIACVLGAAIICVDVVVRLLPGKSDFRIQDSNAFLACSLSLSFGVMLFMSLYSMLPESKEYLKKGGFGEQQAGFILMACFVGGFVGIQTLSRLFHRFLPSHVVDCDHSHDEHVLDINSHTPGRQSSRARSADRRHQSVLEHPNGSKPHADDNGHATESTPLLSTENASRRSGGHMFKRAQTAGADESVATAAMPHGSPSWASTSERRPSMIEVQKKVVSFVKDTKANCDEAGPCYGYSDPCGQECFKHLTSRSGFLSRVPTMLRTTTSFPGPGIEEVAGDDNNHIVSAASVSPRHQRSRAQSRETEQDHQHHECASVFSDDVEAQHHHHVAENAFLSIGLQTSVAIALHKFPEGFITYATNHANPSLGFNVFLALFVHNISEGFALALPLYMALNSRARAILWAFLLGGLSQPLGAGVAVLWFKLARHTQITPDDVAYGCLFAITAGIMASVALQLFVESLSLNHSQNLSILFAFLGMTLLGLSNAFTVDVH
ncbi:ZIP zinc transporter [Biscogniauxia sp. FL1348]|nr:ZIP zinc transporter [Biscogniauxia sp. FL1348]